MKIITITLFSVLLLLQTNTIVAMEKAREEKDASTILKELADSLPFILPQNIPSEHAKSARILLGKIVPDEKVITYNFPLKQMSHEEFAKQKVFALGELVVTKPRWNETNFLLGQILKTFTKKEGYDEPYFVVNIGKFFPYALKPNEIGKIEIVDLKKFLVYIKSIKAKKDLEALAAANERDQ